MTKLNTYFFTYEWFVPLEFNYRDKLIILKFRQIFVFVDDSFRNHNRKFPDVFSPTPKNWRERGRTPLFVHRKVTRIRIFAENNG